MKFRTTTLVIIIAALSLTLAGCGKKNQVGTGVKGNGNGGGSGGINLTTTTAAPTATTAAPTATTAKPTATTAKPTATTAGPEKPFFTFVIQKDAPQINPNRGSCAVGKICRWENHDSVTRSVVADDNSFSSGDIAPGGHWDFRPGPNVKGQHNYTDGTRPYATAVVNFF